MCRARWLLYIQIASISYTKYMRGPHYVISGAVAVWWSRMVPPNRPGVADPDRELLRELLRDYSQAKRYRA